MTTKSEIPVVTMNNTKKELLDAFEVVKQRVSMQQKELMSAERARAEAEKAAALATADRQAETDPVKRVHDLRSSLSKELVGLAERFEQEVNSFKELQKAVKYKQQELESLYGVEAAAGDLAELISLHVEKKKQFEADDVAQKKALDEEMKKLRSDWEQEKKAAQQRVEESRAERKLKWQREQEEYDYSLNREREQRRNALEDELNTVTREIMAKRSEFDLSCEERRKELKQREEVVTEREKNMNTLQKQVESFPAQLDQSITKAVKESSERLKTEFEGKQALAQATFEGQRSVLQSRIDSLEKLVDAQSRQIEQLSTKQDTAYQKVQEIASRAVDSARREYISFGNASSAKQNQEG